MNVGHRQGPPQAECACKCVCTHCAHVYEIVCALFLSVCARMDSCLCSYMLHVYSGVLIQLHTYFAFVSKCVTGSLWKCVCGWVEFERLHED